MSGIDKPLDTPATPQLIWDLPTRVFHWLLVACVLGAWVTAESERDRMLHLALGYSAGVLVAWRLIWGFVGSRYARFSNFVRSPAAALVYLRGYLPAARAAGQTQTQTQIQTHYLGHNPAGGWAVLALLVVVLLSVATGWVSYQDDSLELWSELHELVGNGIMVLVGVHVAAVIATSFLYRENLVRAMVNGYKRARSGEGIPGAFTLLGLVFGFAIVAFTWQVYSGVFPSLTT
jgi:cytochrome b